MRNKKGVIEIQFNWIFVLIAGALILIFFVSVVYKQKQISDAKLSMNILNDLQTIEVGAEVSTLTYSNISSRGNILAFNCDDCNCIYNLKNIQSPNPLPYNSRALFAPSVIDADRIITFSLDWNMPFKVNNFLYMTSDKMRYEFITDSGLPQPIKKLSLDTYNTLHNGMYKNITKEYTHRNEQKVRFVFFDKNRGDVENILNIDSDMDGNLDYDTQKMDYQDVTAINIKPFASNNEVGNVEFYRKKYGENKFEFMGEYKYFGMPSLVGAIIVDDFNLYKCPMDDAYRRLYYVSNVYLDRATDLKTKVTDAKCTVRYGSAIIRLGTIKSEADKRFGSSSLSVARLKDIYDAGFSKTDGLLHYNERLKLFSCPEIY